MGVKSWDEWKGKINTLDREKLWNIVQGFTDPAEREAAKANPRGYLEGKGLSIDPDLRVTLLDYETPTIIGDDGNPVPPPSVEQAQACVSVCLYTGTRLRTDWVDIKKFFLLL